MINLKEGEKAYGYGGTLLYCKDQIHVWKKRTYLTSPCLCGNRVRRVNSDTDPVIEQFKKLDEEYEKTLREILRIKKLRNKKSLT